jgi:hypothetical protein
MSTHLTTKDTSALEVIETHTLDAVQGGIRIDDLFKGIGTAALQGAAEGWKGGTQGGAWKGALAGGLVGGANTLAQGIMG